MNWQDLLAMAAWRSRLRLTESRRSPITDRDQSQLSSRLAAKDLMKVLVDDLPLQGTRQDSPLESIACPAVLTSATSRRELLWRYGHGDSFGRVVAGTATMTRAGIRGGLPPEIPAPLVVVKEYRGAHYANPPR